MSQLLLEGGLYGHLNHLYDNAEMPFSVMKKIFSTASSGELIGTEKTDGQNLFLSYSVAEGKAKAARNKGNIKQGGMDASALAAKFADRGSLEKAFNDAFAAFEQVVSQIDPKMQVKIFGEDANIYYNAEVMDPASANVVNYDTRSLVIHQQGHAEFDRETGNVVDSDVSKGVDILQTALEGVQQSEAAEDFTVQMNALKTLEKLDSDAALREAEARLDKLLGSAGLSDKDTIGDYIVSKLVPLVEDTFPSLDKQRQQLLVKRIFGIKGIKVTDVTKGLDPSVKQSVSAFVKGGKKIMGDIIAPLESIVHDFSVEMLRGLQSAYILDNEKEVKRLAAEVKTAIDAINNSGRDDVMNVMAKHLQKIGGSENISTAAEGFVFDWDGVTYKFTGNFAPANQILGMFKYGRGKMPALQKEVIAEAPEGRNIGIVPGGFKPPHAGHYMGAEHLIKEGGADVVYVLISPKSREGFSKDGENKVTITKRQSLELWELYVEANGMEGKIIPQIASSNSPVGSTYDFAATLNSGDTVILGKGEKDANDKRFAKMKDFLAKKGLDIDVNEINTPMFAGGCSGTTCRRMVADEDFESLKDVMPLTNPADIQTAMEIVSTPNAQDEADEEEAALKKESWMSVIDNLIMEAVRVDHEEVPDGQLGGPKRTKKNKKDDDSESSDNEVNVTVNVETENNVEASADDDDDKEQVDEGVGANPRLLQRAKEVFAAVHPHRKDVDYFFNDMDDDQLRNWILNNRTDVPMDEVANAMSAGGVEGHLVGGKKKGTWADLDTEAENAEQERQNKKNRKKVAKPRMDMIKEEVINLDYGLGLSRSDLPQIKSADMDNFRAWLEEQGVESFNSSMEVGELTPIQKEINLEKVDSMASKHSAGEIDLVTNKPVMVSNDEHIIDGHHRWYALLELDETNELETINIDLPVEELLTMVTQYPGVSYKDATMEEAQWGRFTGGAAPLDEPARDSGQIPLEQLKKLFSIFIEMGLSPEAILQKPEFAEAGITDPAQLQEGYENFGGKSQMIKVGNVRIDIEDMELEPTKHGEERRFRHQKGGKGHKISKDAIVGAVDRAIGLIMNDYANGELGNNEPFHIRMKGKSKQVPALNVIGVLDMKKGPDTMKIITVMRKDDFKTSNFGGKGGPQKTYNVGA